MCKGHEDFEGSCGADDCESCHPTLPGDFPDDVEEEVEEEVEGEKILAQTRKSRESALRELEARCRGDFFRREDVWGDKE